MRIAQEHELRLGIGGPALQIRKIHGIAAIFQHQGIVGYHPTLVLHRPGKGAVHRPLENHLVPRLGEGGYRRVQCRHHAGHRDHLRLANVPAVAAQLPGGSGLAEGFGHRRVGIQAKSRLFHHRIDYRLGAPEVHIRHPHGDGLGISGDVIPLYAVRAFPADWLIKTVLHIAQPLSAAMIPENSPKGNEILRRIQIPVGVNPLPAAVLPPDNGAAVAV